MTLNVCQKTKVYTSCSLQDGRSPQRPPPVHTGTQGPGSLVIPSQATALREGWQDPVSQTASSRGKSNRGPAAAAEVTLALHQTK